MSRCVACWRLWGGEPVAGADFSGVEPAPEGFYLGPGRFELAQQVFIGA